MFILIYLSGGDFGGGGGTDVSVVPVSITVLPETCRFVTFFNTVRDIHATPDFALSGGTMVTLDACKNLCRATAGCVGLDWDQTTGVCIGRVLKYNINVKIFTLFSCA